MRSSLSRTSDRLPDRGQDPPRAHDIGRVEAALDRSHDIERHRIDAREKRLAFRTSDAVLGADAAAELIDDFEDRLLGGGEHPIDAGLVEPLGRNYVQMNIAVADM